MKNATFTQLGRTTGHTSFSRDFEPQEGAARGAGGRSHRFERAIIDTAAMGIRTIEVTDSAAYLDYAADLLARSSDALMLLCVCLRSDTLFARLGAEIWPKNGTIVKSGLPYITTTDLVGITSKHVKSLSPKIVLGDGVIETITGLVVKALMADNIVYKDRGVVAVEVTHRFIPDWTLIKRESVSRQIKAVLDSIQVEGVFRNKQGAAAVYLAPLAQILSVSADRFREIESQWHALDALAVAALLSLTSTELPNEYRAAIELPVVTQFAGNFTLMLQAREYLKNQGQSPEVVLQRIPLLLLSTKLSAAYSAITESGRLRDVPLATLRTNTEVSRLANSFGELTALAVMPQFTLLDVNQQISLFETRQTEGFMLTRMTDAETLVRPIVASMAGIPKRLLGQLANLLALTTLDNTDDAADPSAPVLIGLLCDQLYVDHLAVSYSETVSVGAPLSADEKDLSPWPEFHYIYRPRQRDPAFIIHRIGDELAITDDPAVAIAYAIESADYTEATGAWTTGDQSILEATRDHPLIGDIEGSVKDRYALIPDVRARMSTAVLIEIPLLPDRTVALSIDLMKLLTGVDYTAIMAGSRIKGIYAHQLPAVAASVQAALALLQAGYSTSKGQDRNAYATTAVAMLKPVLQNAQFRAVMSTVRLTAVASLATARERREGMHRLRTGALEARLSASLLAIILMRLALIDFTLYETLIKPKTGVLASDEFINLLALSDSRL